MKAQEAQSKSNQDHYLHELVGVCPCVGGENEYKSKITQCFFQINAPPARLPDTPAARNITGSPTMRVGLSQIELTQSHPAF